MSESLVDGSVIIGGKMKGSLVSIVVLTYQHERYIKDCIMGILSQTYSNIEVLFLDDASTDATLHIIDEHMCELEERCTHVEVIKHSHNLGNISHNANEVLKRCQGSYVYLGSGDDVIAASYVRDMVEYLELNENCVLAYCNGYIISDDWHFGKDNPVEMIYQKHQPLRPDETFKFLLKENYISAATVMIRRNVYEKYGYYDENIKYEDYDMWLRLARYERFGYIDKKLVYYRESVTGLSNVYTSRKFVFMYKERAKVLKKHLQYIEEKERNIFMFAFVKHQMFYALERKHYGIAFGILLINWRLFIEGYVRRYYANCKISVSATRR